MGHLSPFVPFSLGLGLKPAVLSESRAILSWRLTRIPQSRGLLYSWELVEGLFGTVGVSRWLTRTERVARCWLVWLRPSQS